VYRGPVVVVVDANTFSCGDIFAAGIADHGIGQVVAVGEATGAGGANVWTSDDIEYAYHAAGSAVRKLPRLPAGISFSISVRRMARSGLASGIAIEDVGVAGDERYDMTEDDLLHGNVDLIDFCTRLLATT
jgi:C-terminal processing protease CtpA/Prc